MKKSIKISLVIIAVALLSDTSQGPAFEVRVVMPRSAQPLFGILPDRIAAKLNGTPRELRFDSASAGSKIGSVGPGRVELTADGWDLFIETAAEGRVTAATHLVFPLALGGRLVKLNCRPADPANGYLNTTTRAGSDVLVGRFFVELANCKNAESGKAIEWPPAPLTVRGSFVGQPQQQSLEPKLDSPTSRLH